MKIEEKVIYLISTHDEYGSENVYALERIEDISMAIDAVAKDVHFRGITEEKEKLKTILENLDDSPTRQPIDLSNGWGGIQLHIVPLGI